MEDRGLQDGYRGRGYRLVRQVRRAGRQLRARVDAVRTGNGRGGAYFNQGQVRRSGAEAVDVGSVNQGCPRI